MKRNLNIDLLKFMAIIAVVMTHVNSEMTDYQIHSLTWIYGITINTVIKFCVPVFLMSTGAIMLNNKEIPLKKLYSKYILRFVTALVFWNGIYQILNQYYLIKGNMLDGYVPSEIITSLFTGNNKYHLYFMYIIILCYMFLPFIKKLVNNINEKEYKYLLVLLFITSTVIPYLYWFYAPDNDSFFRNFAMNICYLGMGYMIFGKYMNENRDKFSLKKSAAGIIVLLIFIVFDIYRRSSSETFMGYWNVITPFIFIYSCLVFIIGLKVKISEKYKGFITFLSKGSFFVYLSHLVLLDYLRFRGLSVMNYQSAAAKFIYPIGVTFILLAVCYVLYYFLRKVPVLNKYIM